MNKWPKDKPFDIPMPPEGRATQFGAMLLFRTYINPDADDDKKIQELCSKPDGTTTDELCAAFGLDEDDRKKMGFPFYVANPRRHVVMYRREE